GIGASGALLIGVLRRKMTWPTLFECLKDTARTTAMIFTIVFGAFVFANFITLSGLTAALIDMLQQQNMGTLGLLLMMMVIYLILGALMESLSLLILTAPIFHAIATSVGIHPIWFGIFVVMMIEIGLLTPPVGMNVFTVKTMNPDVPIRTIFKGSMPFVAANMGGVGVFIAFPIIGVFLLRWV
ncbi:MAG: C4-dicarboxylate ABC transporter permease, partial [Alcaligenaceae bacterium]|nr:C4-dicarboxylate ABC transporter permease [Alcaligenaceae bacterium]